MSNPSDIWAKLTRPSDGLAARLHPESSNNVWLALDFDGRRHLLVRATTMEPNQVLMATRGLRAMTVELSVEQEPKDVWVDIACIDPTLNDTFVAVADSLAEDVRANPNDPVAAVHVTLRRWQWFWGIDPANLSTEKALGLFGELWFIDRWAPFPDAIDIWLGPAGHRHDFTATTISVEVKATQVRSDGPARHRITHLDQLAPPETGALYLFSLQAICDPNAGNTLPGLIGRIRGRLGARPELVGLFDQRLGQAGWSPAYADRHTQPYRIVAEEFYQVGEGFPRLVRGSFVGGTVPVGVDEITYTLDLAACSEWRVASHPSQVEQILADLKL